MTRTLSLRSAILCIALVLFLATACSSERSELTAPEDPTQPLVLVMYGDSLLWFPGSGVGAIDMYSEMMEEDLGAPVEVRTPISDYGYPPWIIDELNSEQGQSDLAEADVVIIESPIDVLAIAVLTAAGLGGLSAADCGGDDNQQCLRDSLAEYKDSVDEIFSLLTETVDPSETLVRAVDVYSLAVKDQLAAGTLEMTNPYWQEAQEFFADTAAEYGIPTASVFAEFMGPEGIDDPQDSGLVASDQLHPTETGAGLVAKLIRDLGYGFAD